MKVKILIPLAGNPMRHIGDVVDYPTVEADSLIAAGIAEPVKKPGKKAK